MIYSDGYRNDGGWNGCAAIHAQIERHDILINMNIYMGGIDASIESEILNSKLVGM